MQKIALFGGAGAIGKSIADACGKEGRPYRVVGRDLEQLKRSFKGDPLAAPVAWNPDDPESVRLACRGVEALVYLIGVPYDRFDLHPVLMQKTLDGAIAEGVNRVILIGTVYPYGRPRTATVDESHPREPHTYKGKKRKEQEDVLLKAHEDGKIKATILRLPDFYGPGVQASFLHLLFQAAAKGGTADIVGPIDVPHEFMYVPDVGPVVLALESEPQAYGKWWNFAGAGAITQREIAKKVFGFAGREPKIRVAGKTMLRIIGLFKPIMRELVEMHYLITTPVLMDDSALHRLLGPIRKTPYDEGLRRTFDAYKGG